MVTSWLVAISKLILCQAQLASQYVPSHTRLLSHLFYMGWQIEN